jgi:outer membrane protein OmpA-like peptidoglycan-associated protein
MGTKLSPQAKGRARVEAKKGVTNIEVSVTDVVLPSALGTEFLTYVLWAVSTEGRAVNLGELIVDEQGNGRLKTTTQLQTFSLVATAEPYFSIRHPSELVVLENELRRNTKGRIFAPTDYKLMKRSQYEKMENPLALSVDTRNVPLEMYQARNAVDIARSRGAGEYAREIFPKAEASLKIAESLLARKASKREIASVARQTVQFSEDARALTAERQEEERIAQEKAAAADKAKAHAEAVAAAEAAEAKRRADEEARRQSELAAAREAQLRAEAAARQAKIKAEADAAAARAEIAAAKARAEEEAALAEAERARQAAEALRAQLLEQFNRILETRDTPRGLVVNLGDVLFDTAKFDLRPPAREKLARLSGIVLAHPGLILAVEGHTDSVGGDEFNQKLSESRAQAVRAFLIEQGLDTDCITAEGFGKTMPTAENTTAAGRQRNRRVEIIVSGHVIGIQVGR